MGVGRHLSRLGNSVSVTLPLDGEGYIDRQCPVASCEGFFKVKPGTGLPEPQGCICPYCGHRGPHEEFYSKSQIKYGQDMTFRKVTDAFSADLKDALRPSRGGFVTMTVKETRQPPVYYRHKHLPTSLSCSACTCEYKIEGFTGRCPDCGASNTAQSAGDNQ